MSVRQWTWESHPDGIMVKGDGDPLAMLWVKRRDGHEGADAEAEARFIVDACNAAEQRSGEMCDCPTPTAYGCARVIVDAIAPSDEPSEAGKAVLRNT